MSWYKQSEVYAYLLSHDFEREPGLVNWMTIILQLQVFKKIVKIELWGMSYL